METIRPSIHGLAALRHPEARADAVVDVNFRGFAAAFHAANSARQPFVTLKCVAPTAMKSGGACSGTFTSCSDGP